MKNSNLPYDVSRETFDLLKRYEASLHEWQQRMNLVSKNSLEFAWQRHFLDSMQVYSLLPKDAQIVYDLGSGAGFPGMVLAIMAKENTPYLNFKLVESIAKKTLYLNEVKKMSGANVEILNQRIETIKPEIADAITSRALASLQDLLKYARPFCGEKTECIFLKGRSYETEVAEARKNWKFDLEMIPSQQSSDGVILIIRNLHHKGEKNA